MLSFGTYFLICNIFITIIISVILTLKRILHHHLSQRVQYNLWFLVLIPLMVPFIPFRPVRFQQFFSWLNAFFSNHISGVNTASETTAATPHYTAANWINDFSISVNKDTPSILNYLFVGIWLIGILAMIILVVKSRIRLYRLEQSALPLQNQKIHKLFETCMHEMDLHKNVSIYSTAFLKSPIIVGLISPRIYMPIHLITDCSRTDIRYMLLHELQHYKHKDALVNYFINLAGVLYWFHPLVWYAIKEIKNDREIACDSSVLQMLDEDEYTEYGNTLINFAEKISLSPLSFTTGIGGSMKQLKKRILNIASYQPKTKWKKRKERCIFLLVALLLIETTALIPTHASNNDKVSFTAQNTGDEDLSSFFGEYNGCFVLYDLNSDFWQIYNKNLATKRVSPDSTYKIYSALFALEHQFITPSSSSMNWNGEIYPIPQWNKNQNLTSALQNSVNWYFQTLDQQAGLTALKHFYTELDYGNHNLSGGISDFWRESSLKISALEQVKLLKKLYTNEFQFKEQNTQAVKNAMRLSPSDKGILYGKTGTGAVNNENINGWFIGYVETSNNTYFFATNIQSDSNADGATASEITLNILQSKDIY